MLDDDKSVLHFRYYPLIEDLHELRDGSGLKLLNSLVEDDPATGTVGTRIALFRRGQINFLQRINQPIFYTQQSLLLERSADPFVHSVNLRPGLRHDDCGVPLFVETKVFLCELVWLVIHPAYDNSAHSVQFQKRAIRP